MIVEDGAKEHRGTRLSELGELGAVVGGRWIPVRGPRQISVLAMLACRGSAGVRADELVDAAWPPELQLSTAAQSLRNTIGRLRSALGPCSIEATGGGYRLAASVSSDRAMFCAHLVDSQVAAEQGLWKKVVLKAEGALELWRGDPWPDLDGIDEIESDRARLLVARRQLLNHLADALSQLGEMDRAVPHYRQLLDEDSTNERLWSSLALAVSQTGSRANAIEVVHEARRALASSGLDVGSDLERIEASLLEDFTAPLTIVSPTTTGVSELPDFRTPFIGRQRELSELGTHIGRRRLITITGPSGAGKTRLAAEVARHAKSRTQFVSLVGVESIDASSTIEIVDGVDLLVIDNCEHVTEAIAALIDSLLSDHGDLTILATSRLVLHVLGEFVYVIPTYDEGERLFAERCNAHGVPLASSFAREDASVISELVDHLPLAIELAASYIRFRSTSEIIDSLREGEIVESQWMQVPRHRSFDAALSASLELLSLEQRTACRRLAECEVNFTFERAASIVGVDECRPLLNELIDQSLIDLLRTAEGSTYRMLTPIRHAMLRTAP